MRARIGDEVVEIPEDARVSRSHGDIENVYDTCGLMGLCPTCAAKGVGGCGKHYACGTVRAVSDDRWYVEPPGGDGFYVDEILDDQD